MASIERTAYPRFSGAITAAELPGRITTGGVITEYAVPTAASSPVDITRGPDGALWFTEMFAEKIGRIFAARNRALDSMYPPQTDAPLRDRYHYCHR